MDTETRGRVVVITHGIDRELSSADLTVALGGLSAGLKVSNLLAISGVDIAVPMIARSGTRPDHRHP